MSPATAMRADHTSEVDNRESLIRRFPSEPEGDFPNSKFPRIAHLLPNKGDPDGLSLNREEFIYADNLLKLAENPKIRSFGGVLAVLAGWFRDLGLTVKPDQSDTPGHVIIPEMNRTLYDSSLAEEQRIKGLADKLDRGESYNSHPSKTDPKADRVVVMDVTN